MRALFSSVVVAGLVLVSSRAGAQDEAHGAVRISVAEAEQLVDAWARGKTPTLVSTVSFPLTELTTDAIWARLGAQVFRVNAGHFERQTFLIARNEVNELGIAVGWPGVTSMRVTDLDHDGFAELAYTYSWGSGMHRSQVALYAPRYLEPFLVAKASMGGQEDWTLDGSDDQALVLTIPDLDHPGARVRIGALQLLEGKDQKVDRPRLLLSVDARLPEEIAKQVWASGD